MTRYLDPKYDLTFKRVFGEHKRLCISLLNSLLPLEEGRQVVSIEYETGELMPDIEALRHSIVDVRCKDNYGRHFIVEMQMDWSESFKSRVLFNASKVYVKQLKKGEGFRFLQPVYALNFLDEVFEKSPGMADEYYHHYKLVNVLHADKSIEGLELVFIELPKFKPGNRAGKKLHDLWLRFLTEINEATEEAPKDLLDCEETKEAVEYMKAAAYTDAELYAYDKLWDSIASERTLIMDALDEGLNKGRAEGEEERLKLQQERMKLQQENEEKDKEIAELKRLLGRM